MSLDELGDCVSGTDTVESEIEKRYIENAIDEFLRRQTEEKRIIFIRRYWYFDSIQTINHQRLDNQNAGLAGGRHGN